MRLILVLLLALASIHVMAGIANACPADYVPCGRGVCCPG
jgi:hypothetical protein